MMGKLLESLAPILAARSDRFVLASMAAGLDAQHIQAMAGGNYPVICFMPNTPVAVGAGVVQYYGQDATEEELAAFQALLSPAGLVDRVNPDRLNAASAVSGCGPAFCAIFIEEPSPTAGWPAACPGQGPGLRGPDGGGHRQADAGTAPPHPGTLKDGVCSPGGTTIQGVRTLEDRGFRSAVIEAVIAAYDKTVSMGN